MYHDDLTFRSPGSWHRQYSAGTCTAGIIIREYLNILVRGFYQQVKVSIERLVVLLIMRRSRKRYWGSAVSYDSVPRQISLPILLARHGAHGVAAHPPDSYLLPRCLHYTAALAFKRHFSIPAVVVQYPCAHKALQVPKPATIPLREPLKAVVGHPPSGVSVLR